MLKVKLVYREPELGEAWREQFEGQKHVELVGGDITKLDCDAIVSPANSFGFMDGGLDLALSERFGWGVQDRLQEMIGQLDEKELLIGKSLTVETHDNNVPYVISAPTMRVPMSFNIATSVNAYLAMKAALIAANKHPKIKTLAVPGMCTGSGRMPFHIAALQMFLAYNEVILGNTLEYKEYGDAQRYQYRLNEKGLIWDF